MINYIRWNPNPVIFELGSFALRWYSLLFLIGVVISYEWMRRAFKKAKLPSSLFDELSLWVIFGGIAGARLAHCLFYDFAYFSEHPWEIILPFSWEPTFHFTGYRGLASHGGAFGVLLVLGIFMYRKRKDFPLWFILDELALVIPLTGCFIRLGNLMNSEIIGHPTEVPWAFIFTSVDKSPRHPAQLYEAIGYFLLFLLMNLYAWRNPKSAPGFKFGLFLVLLFTIRISLEFFKRHQAEFTIDWLLNMGQLLSLPFIIVGLVLMLTRYKTSVSKSA